MTSSKPVKVSIDIELLRRIDADPETERRVAPPSSALRSPATWTPSGAGR